MSLLGRSGTDYLGNDCDGSFVLGWSWTNSQVDLPWKGMDQEKQTADRTEEAYESRKDEEDDNGGTQKYPGSRRNPRGTLIAEGSLYNIVCV